MQQLTRGILIAIEGIDGSGKSTLTKDLLETLQTKYATVSTKEPGATALGKKLRAVLQEKTVPHCAKSEFLLFAADRAQHFKEIVLPALTHNNIVISDRMSDSSVVYQGYGRGLDIPIINIVNNWAMNNKKPDITLYVKIDKETAFERMQQRGKLTAFEQEQRAFIKQLVAGFNELYKNRINVYTLDGAQKPEVVTKQAIKYIETWIQQNKLT